MRARTVSWLLSLGLHLAALALILVLAPPQTLRAVFGVELSDEELAAMLPDEVAAPPREPVYTPISPNKELVHYGGRNATEEELFREFAEAGGLVGGIEQTSYGPKVRFGTTLFEHYHSYYVSGLVGHFRTGEGLDVYIVDGRKDPRIGKLMLHVPAMDMTRALTEYNSRYIYTYGPTLLSEEPIEGSVMFMGDGDKIYRLMWMPKKGRALYPERVYAQAPAP